MNKTTVVKLNKRELKLLKIAVIKEMCNQQYTASELHSIVCGIGNCQDKICWDNISQNAKKYVITAKQYKTLLFKLNK